MREAARILRARRDERGLRVLALHESGRTHGEIADAVGLARRSVATKIQRLRNAALRAVADEAFASRGVASNSAALPLRRRLGG